MKFWTKNTLRVLGVSNKEGLILEGLRRLGTCNTTVIAERAAIPRVTTLRLLSGLCKRGFVTRRARGREVLWTAVPTTEIQKVFSKIVSSEDSVFPTTVLSEVGSITIYRGVEGIIETNRRILAAKVGERLLAIEPNGIWKYVAYSPQDAWTHLNKLFKAKNILVEMIAEEGFEEQLTRVDAELRRTFLDIITDIRVVPVHLLDSATEILIFRDQIFFIDWAHSVAVEIKNPSTMRVMRALFLTLQHSGRKVSVQK